MSDVSDATPQPGAPQPPTSCKDCKPPTRYPGCSAKCPVGLAREERKQALYAARKKDGIYREYMMETKRKLRRMYQDKERRQGDK